MLVVEVVAVEEIKGSVLVVLVVVLVLCVVVVLEELDVLVVFVVVAVIVVVALLVVLALVTCACTALKFTTSGMKQTRRMRNKGSARFALTCGKETWGR